jgi:recombinational DNA repair ATPase RecF
MQDELLRILEERLAADKSDRQDWSLYVLAACEGEATLNDVLGSAATAGRQRTAFAAAPITHEPVGAYLKSIEVEGFRGVGPARRLELAPGPGLTLVVGRNGSGKSSFAEALEILLTGANWRWKDRSAVWREGWRNLHHPSPTRVGAEIAVEGTPGITTATRAWPDGTDLAAGIATVRKPGGKPADLDALGWAGPLETYRPFLSYNELGSMLEAGPTELHDRLSNILGLADLERAQQVLKDARLPREKGLAGVSKRLTPLMTRLEGLPDERAKRARQAFGGKKWDLDAAEGALGSATDAAGADELAILRALAGLVVPSVEEALGLAEELESLDARRKALAATPAGQAHQIAGLLRSAMDWHGAHGDGDCPVCGRTAAMDDAWRENAQKRITELDELAREAHELEVEALRAADRTSRLTAAPPAILDRAREVGLDSTPLLVAWRTFAAPPADGAGLADNLVSAIGPLVDAADAFKAQAAAEVGRREDLWRPIATELAAWLSDAREAQVAGASVANLESAEKWLKQAAVAIRQQRFEPIADKAVEYWKVLRQQSSVELDRVILEGTGPSRHLTVDVTIDGQKNAALAVMSQGELHAIALSLFLPRATLPESPFRFVVIDDPVQSMDPSRVDGLARVLQSVAAGRQVIVFTHDDRLPEAVRRLGIDARIIEVTRHEDSNVDLRLSLDPVARNLDDARALVRTRELPEVVAHQVVPSFCRAAIEAACIEVVRRRRIERGESHLAVEAELERAAKTTSKLALAIFDDANRGGEVAAKVQGWGEAAADAWGISTRGAHAGYRGSLDEICEGTASLCRRIREIH